MADDPYHDLLSSRFVCQVCLTRYFAKHHRCKACGQVGRIQPLCNSLFGLADTDQELREMIAAGQRFGDRDSNYQG